MAVWERNATAAAWRMKGEETGLSDYASGTRPVISASNAALVFLTTTVLALACFLAAYVTGTREIASLQQAGFVWWPDSTIWADVLGLPSPGVSPGSSVWYRFTPGARLEFAFACLPMLRACVSGLAVFCGGMAGMLAAIRWRNERYSHKEILCLGAAIAIIAGMAEALPQTPDGFTFDLHQNIITNAVLKPGNQAPLANLSNIATYIHHGRHSSGTIDVYANYADGHTFGLVSLNLWNQGHDLQQLLLTFLTSDGKQL
jgi:hypothetical protein